MINTFFLAVIAIAGAPTHPPSLKVNSSVESVRVVPAITLPANPDGGHIDEYCTDLNPRFDIKPGSAGGRYAASRGWLITSETKLGKYDAVTMVGALDAATSGTCVHRDGNLAIFEGSHLIAIAYQRPRRSSEEAYPDGIGSAEQMDPRRIRLRWGLPAAPMADVVLRDGFYVERTPKEDSACGGRVLVPNIFELDIRKARRKLLANGWKPVRSSEKNYGLEAALRKQGVVEAEICSGTGYGFCIFNYAKPKGVSLVVTSAGDGDTVISYDVQCGQRRSM